MINKFALCRAQLSCTFRRKNKLTCNTNKVNNNISRSIVLDHYNSSCKFNNNFQPMYPLVHIQNVSDHWRLIYNQRSIYTFQFKFKSKQENSGILRRHVKYSWRIFFHYLYNCLLLDLIFLARCFSKGKNV